MPLNPSGIRADREIRRFACTACGRCCNRGPELELSEATALAGTFVTSILFKGHSLPIDAQSDAARAWWRAQGSRIPIGPALEERRRHLNQFATRKRIERARGRHVYLTISAIVDNHGTGRCPALAADNLCSIYPARPLTCRTVPLHYSRPASTLQAYLDGFTAMETHRCETGPSAPAVLDRNTILDTEIRQHRDDAVRLFRADRAWRDRLAALMDDPAKAQAAELPTFDSVLAATDAGYATSLPMIVAWRVARDAGILTTEALDDICRQQAQLITAEIGRVAATSRASSLHEVLAVYEFELANGRRARMHAAILAKPA